MHNNIRKKFTLTQNFHSKEINNDSNKNKPPLIQSPIQEEYRILKKNTMFINNSRNHRSFFLNLLKKRNLIKKNLKKEITIERIIELFSKDSSSRTNIENKEIGIYLSNKFDFFKKIKDEDGWPKLDRIISICQFKKYINDDIIINYEEKESKVFILLKGNVGIYRPVFVEKTLTLKDFLNILYSIENKENNLSKYNRIKEKNKENSLDISFYEKMSNNEGIMKQYLDFYLEDYEKIGKIEEGQVFGAQINEYHNIISDKAIKSEKESLLIFFDIDEYRKIEKRYEGKRYKKNIENFRNDYPFFKFFTDDKIIDIFKHLTSKTLYRDEYLYKQNNNDDKIYFIMKGKFNMYSSISFNWLTDYLDYIKDSKTNLIYYLIKKLPKNKEEYIELSEELQDKVIKSPMIEEKISNIEKIIEKMNEKNVYGVKIEEENINDAQRLFRINIKNLKKGDMVGMEDCIEFKNRYCSVQCISNVGEVKYISRYDLMRIIKIYNSENNYMNNHLLEFNSKIKFTLYQQIIKDVQNLENKLTVEFDTKYNDLIKPNKENKTINEKNMSIAAIKVKGFKYDIKEVFDKSIPIFPNYKKSNSQNYFLKNQILLKNLLGSPNKKSRRIFKYKLQKRKPILTIDNPNNLSINADNKNKEILNIYKREKSLTEKIFSHISKKEEISLSTNISNNIINQNKSLNPSRNKNEKKKFYSSYNRLIKNQTIKTYLNSFENINELKSNNSKNQLHKNFNYFNERNKSNLIWNNTPLSENSKDSGSSNLNYLYLGKRKSQSLKNIKNDKRKNKECIETILSEKFGQINKKYYLGSQFKNQLDKEKRKFNLIHYKNYFNKL